MYLHAFLRKPSSKTYKTISFVFVWVKNDLWERHSITKETRFNTVFALYLELEMMSSPRWSTRKFWRLIKKYEIICDFIL